MRLIWSPPDETGGRPIESYVVKLTKPGHTLIKTSTSSPYTVTGLDFATNYTIEIKAVNSNNDEGPFATFWAQTLGNFHPPILFLFFFLTLTWVP